MGAALMTLVIGGRARGGRTVVVEGIGTLPERATKLSNGLETAEGQQPKSLAGILSSLEHGDRPLSWPGPTLCLAGTSDQRDVEPP